MLGLRLGRARIALAVSGKNGASNSADNDVRVAGNWHTSACSEIPVFDTKVSYLVMHPDTPYDCLTGSLANAQVTGTVDLTPDGAGGEGGEGGTSGAAGS